MFGERSLFFLSFQTAISIEWEIKEMVHEEREIAGMCEKLSSEGKMEHLLERTAKSRDCPVNIRQTNPLIKRDTKETMLLIKGLGKGVAPYSHAENPAFTRNFFEGVYQVSNINGCNLHILYEIQS